MHCTDPSDALYRSYKNYPWINTVIFRKTLGIGRTKNSFRTKPEIFKKNVLLFFIISNIFRAKGLELWK